MKAKCPNCKEGCSKCKDGYINIEMAEGILYIPWCLDCDKESMGFHISDDGKPPEIDDCICIDCNSKNIVWIIDGYSKGGSF